MTKSKLIAAGLLLAASAFAVDGPDASGRGGEDFDRAVVQVSQALGTKPVWIPLSGFVSSVSGLFRPFGAKDIRFAIFEGSRQPASLDLAGLGPAIVSIDSRNDRVRIHARREGSWFRVLALVLDSDDAVVVSARLKPNELGWFIRKVREGN